MCWNRLARPHRRRGLASDGVRYAGARSSVDRRVWSVTKPRLEWYGGVSHCCSSAQNTHEKWWSRRQPLSLSTHLDRSLRARFHIYVYLESILIDRSIFMYVLLEEEKQATHTNTQRETTPHNTRHDKNSNTNDHSKNNPLALNSRHLDRRLRALRLNARVKPIYIYICVVLYVYMLFYIYMIDLYIYIYACCCSTHPDRGLRARPHQSISVCLCVWPVSLFTSISISGSISGWSWSIDLYLDVLL